MYKLSYFTEQDPAVVLAFMKAYPFAVVTAAGKDYPVATHLPLAIEEIESKMVFTGHIMRNTDHHKAFTNNDRVLVIFNGPHCHVSAGWYPNPHLASTWNYISVHAKGRISFVSESETMKIIEDITIKYEGAESGSSFQNIPEEYKERLVKAIVGFTIQVDSYENVFKLSQNHNEETKESIVSHLEARGDDNAVAIALEMRKRR